MATLKCNACGGEYDDVQADGVRYFHVCPPLQLVRVKLSNGTLRDLASNVTVETFDDPILGKGTRRTFDPPLPKDAVFLGVTFQNRANHRDENVPSKLETATGTVKAIGAGAVELEARTDAATAGLVQVG